MWKGRPGGRSRKLADCTESTHRKQAESRKWNGAATPPSLPPVMHDSSKPHRRLHKLPKQSSEPSIKTLLSLLAKIKCRIFWDSKRLVSLLQGIDNCLLT